jgi:hypothetical protein
LFVTNADEERIVYDGEREINRKLHETAINHRFAVYLERTIIRVLPLNYSVDLEYNRYYYGYKRVNTAEGLIKVRPDILVHSRTNREVVPQHYMAIEAKKYAITDHDIVKIHGLMNDPRYRYLFGVTVSYCESEQDIHATLYFILEEPGVKELSIRVRKHALVDARRS